MIDVDGLCVINVIEFKSNLTCSENTYYIINMNRTNKKGETIHKGARKIILGVYKYFQETAECMSVTKLVEKTSEVTGISVATIYRIRNQAAKGPLYSPGKRKMKRKGLQRNDRLKTYDDNIQSNIRRIVSTYCNSLGTKVACIVFHTGAQYVYK